MEDLSEAERQVLERIASNPYAGQQEIAEALGMPRPTVASHIAQLIRKGYVLGKAYVLAELGRLVCFGGASVDNVFHAHSPIAFGTSNPVTGRQTFGGVARNVAENAIRLGAEVGLVSVIGDDESGRSLLRHLQGLSVDASRMLVSNTHRTASYSAILTPDNQLAFGFSDMGIFDGVTVSDVERLLPYLSSASWVFADCNLSEGVLEALRARRGGARYKLALGAVSVAKSARLPSDLSGVDALFIGTAEGMGYLKMADDTSPRDVATALRDRGADLVVLADDGQVVVAGRDGVDVLPVQEHVRVDITGASDALAAGVLAALLAGETVADAVALGALAEAVTAESEATVHPEMSRRLLDAARQRMSMPRRRRNAKRA